MPGAEGRIACVVPAFNEAASIRGIAAAAACHCPCVIVVDDGSADGTGERLAGLPVDVIRHPENRGKAASLWTGWQHALATGADAVITLDADGQHPPEAIPRLLAAHADHPDRLIIAARLIGRERMPAARRFGNRVADFWISWAAGWPIVDTQSGFRLYPRGLIERVEAAHDRQHGFAFESEVLIDACRAGYRPLAVPIAAIYAPTLRPSHYRPIRDTLAIIRMVAGKLLARGMDLPGLISSRRPLPPG
jgi:glycosyltransferase involved in cell wall biosynthesis